MKTQTRIICIILTCLMLCAVLTVASILPACVRLEDDSTSWEKEMFCGAVVYAMTEDGGRLYAGTGGSGVYAANSSKEWEAVNEGLSGDALFVFALTAGRDGQIYAGTWDGIYRYDGERWNAMKEGLKGAALYVNTIFEDADGALYAGTGGGVFRYENGGWLQTGLCGEDGTYYDVYALVLFDNILYAGTYGGGVYRYADGQWSATGSGLDENALYVQSLAVSDGTLYAGTFGGAYAYDYNVWTAIELSAEEQNTVYSLYQIDSMIYAGTHNGVYKYARDTWELTGGAFAVYALAELDGVLYAGTNGGIYRYDGESWYAQNGGMLLPGPMIWSLAESADGRVYAGTYGCGVYTRGDEYWIPINDGLTGYALYVRALTEHDGVLYADSHSGVYRYDGESWNPDSEMDALFQDNAASVIELLDADGSFYIGRGNGLYKAPGPGGDIITQSEIMEIMIIMGLNPGETVTRAEAAQMVAAYLNIFWSEDNE